MSKLKDSYKIHLRCVTCGCKDQFDEVLIIVPETPITREEYEA